MPTTPKTQHHKERAAFQLQAHRLAGRVRAERAARGWTIEQAAERFGVEPAHVRRIEKGTTNPTLSVIVSIARAFSVSTSSMLAPGVSTNTPPLLDDREADWVRQAIVSRLAMITRESSAMRAVVAALAESKDGGEFWLLVRDHGPDVLGTLVDTARKQKRSSVANACMEGAMALALAIVAASSLERR